MDTAFSHQGNLEAKTFHVELEPGHKPPYRPPNRLSPAEMDELKQQLEKLLAAGVLRPCSSPYGAPVLFAPKKDGGYRMCCDFRALNRITVKDRFNQSQNRTSTSSPSPHPWDNFASGIFRSVFAMAPLHFHVMSLNHWPNARISFGLTWAQPPPPTCLTLLLPSSMICSFSVPLLKIMFITLRLSFKLSPTLVSTSKLAKPNSSSPRSRTLAACLARKLNGIGLPLATLHFKPSKTSLPPHLLPTTLAKCMMQNSTIPPESKNSSLSENAYAPPTDQTHPWHQQRRGRCLVSSPRLRPRDPRRQLTVQQAYRHHGPFCPSKLLTCPQLTLLVRVMPCRMMSWCGQPTTALERLSPLRSATPSCPSARWASTLSAPCLSPPMATTLSSLSPATKHAPSLWLPPQLPSRKANLPFPANKYPTCSSSMSSATLVSQMLSVLTAAPNFKANSGKRSSA
mmetsp:Transcript_29720/g.46590  ORF Transcript_29720/g.46590 Transcript_29720/m.46590 type:complete len:455 (+) Transcript_29720:2610-3974(+)